MNSKDLLRAIGDIDDKYLEEEYETPKDKNKKEFYMKIIKNKKIIYALSSACAVFILGIGILAGQKKTNKNIIKTEDEGMVRSQNMNIMLEINPMQGASMAKLDADAQTVEITSIPEKFEFINNIELPSEYKLDSSYEIFTRENLNTTECDLLHDYVFNYSKDYENSIKVAFSEVEEPIRDYFLDNSKKTSKIGDVDVIISQYEKMYVATFRCKDIYFDIETNGITEEEMINLLESIIKII
ncbi:MAG: hypothetical protein DBY41_07865 [Clostridium sp.]|nr:MAG: hypothetical protein DBY41_07865 [Clostridium sp.]